MKALGAMETWVESSPGLGRLGGLSGGRSISPEVRKGLGSIRQSRRDVLQVRGRRVQRTWLEKVAWCGSWSWEAGIGRGWGLYVRTPDRDFWHVMRTSQEFSAGRDGMGFSSRLFACCRP